MKMYCGTRSHEKHWRGLRTFSPEVRVLVQKQGEPDHDYRLPHYIRHSPCGFEWGYGGSGPAELARCILIDLVGEPEANEFYGSFKWDIIAGLQRDEFRLTEGLVRRWLEAKRRNRAANLPVVHCGDPKAGKTAIDFHGERFAAEDEDES